MANAQNIVNLIGRAEYNIGRMILLVSILCPLLRKERHSFSVERNNKNFMKKDK